MLNRDQEYLLDALRAGDRLLVHPITGRGRLQWNGREFSCEIVAPLIAGRAITLKAQKRFCRVYVLNKPNG